MIPDYADIENRKGALSTARMLLDCGAVRFDLDQPFTACDGIESPLHVDARPLLGWPDRRRRLIDLAVDTLRRDIAVEGGQPMGIDAVACCTQGQGVPFATLIADRLDLPLFFVRRTHSDDPHKNDVEGRIKPGWRVLLVEQLAADGRRKAGMIKALRAAGATVTDLLVVFQYGVFDALHAQLSPLGVRLHALATWWDIQEEARGGGDLPADALAEIDAFLRDPCHWHALGCREERASA